jgi:hypothetical protein
VKGELGKRPMFGFRRKTDVNGERRKPMEWKKTCSAACLIAIACIVAPVVAGGIYDTYQSEANLPVPYSLTFRVDPNVEHPYCAELVVSVPRGQVDSLSYVVWDDQDRLLASRGSFRDDPRIIQIFPGTQYISVNVWNGSDWRNTNWLPNHFNYSWSFDTGSCYRIPASALQTIPPSLKSIR